MRHRSATTLVEVLVAIFIMGVGLLAILALFPIGAYRMGQAIQDSRTANMAESCDAIANIWALRSSQNLSQFPPAPPGPPATDYFLNPGGGVPAIPATSFGASYPVLVDPTGYLTASPSFQLWVGGTAGYAIPRVSARFIQEVAVNGSPYFLPGQSPQSAATQWFSFLDDITFDTNGLPKPTIPGSLFTGTNVVERDVRYSWAFLCQRPNASNQSVVNLTTIIYNRRALSLSGNIGLPEYAYGGAGNGTFFDLTRNVVSVDYSNTNALPPVKAGEWILDASLDNSNVPHGYFYRVVSVNQVGPTTVEFEVQTPFRGFPPNTITFGPGPNVNLMVLEGVAEVFERGPAH